MAKLHQEKLITQLLNEFKGRNREVIDQLFSLVYNELHCVAHHYMLKERSSHTLNTTALIHESFLNLVGRSDMHWQNRAHFFAIAAQVMRHILVDYARGRKSLKRGGNLKKSFLDDLPEVFTEERAEEIVALDEALKRLESFDEQKSKVVEYRFFGGLTIDETAAVLSISVAKVKREWKLARAWLYREVTETI